MEISNGSLVMTIRPNPNEATILLFLFPQKKLPVQGLHIF